MALFLKKKCFQLLSFEGSLCPAFLGLTLQELSPHALYMRLKRLCARTNTGKLQVPEEAHTQWISGNRDELSVALCRALKTYGFDSGHKTRQLVRVGVWKFQGFIDFVCWFACSQGLLSNIVSPQLTPNYV